MSRGMALRRSTPAPVVVGAQRQLSMDALLHAFFRNRSIHTMRAYERDLEDFGRFLAVNLGVVSTDALRMFFTQGAGAANELVVHYRADLERRGFAPSSIVRHLATLRSIARFGRMIGMVSWTIEVPGPTVERVRDTRGSSVTDARRLLALVAAEPEPRNLRDGAMVRLMLDLGLRVSEVIGIDVEDVEESAVWVKGKGKKTKQRLSVPAPTAAALAAWLQHRGSPTTGPVFVRQRLDVQVGHDDGRLLTRSVYRLVKDYGHRLGLRLHPHKLRHTAITVAVEQARQHDIGLEEVQPFSRHRSIHTLLGYRDQTRDVQGTLATLVTVALAKGDAQQKA